MIELRGITKTYQMEARDVVAVDGVDLTIGHGEFLALKGPSGSGKSTLLNIIGLVDVPTTGSYTLDGVAMDGANAKQRSEQRRRHLGFVFQDFNLIPELSVAESVEIPLLISRYKQSERRRMVEQVVEDVGLSEHIRHKPGELSGGQQQRVAIARALVRRPPVVVADEPTANLDTATGRGVVQVMKQLNERYGVTCIFATHDELITDTMKRIVHLWDGRIDRIEERNGE